MDLKTKLVSLKLAQSAAKLGVSVCDAMDEVFDDIEGPILLAARMATVQTIMMEMAERVAEECDVDPLTVVGWLCEAAVQAFPEPEPPKVEDLPKRAVRPGPSPWGL